MAKRIINILLALIVLISTCGITFNKHFCHGKLISVSIFDKPESCCGGTCKSCHSESTSFKLKDNFLVSLEIIPPVSIELAILFEYFEIISIEIFKEPQFVFLSSSPPLIGDSVFLLFRTFRL